jgi:hypothetical protein
LLAVLMLSAPALAEPVRIQVQVDGAVAQPSMLTLQGHARLSDAAIAARPLPDAYMLGAAWLRPALKTAQQRLKAGVLFDLDNLQHRAGNQGTELAALAQQLHQWISAMPVTGREPALLDPRVVEVIDSENRPLADGDRLYYPLRPDTVRVVGAMQHACALALVPLQDARKYLAACPRANAADSNIIYVIEPDGRVFVQGVALWNLSPPRTLAPGSIIYVPLRAVAIKPVDASLNSDIASFLATQTLPGAEPQP